MTLEIPGGFFVFAGKLPSTTMEEDISTGLAYNYGGYRGVDSIPQGTHTRRKVLCTLPSSISDNTATDN